MDCYYCTKDIESIILFGENVLSLRKSQSIMELYHGLEQFDPSNREGHSARIYFNTLFR